MRAARRCEPAIHPYSPDIPRTVLRIILVRVLFNLPIWETQRLRIYMEILNRRKVYAETSLSE
jgi:hypothetical protein